MYYLFYFIFLIRNSLMENVSDTIWESFLTELQELGYKTDKCINHLDQENPSDTINNNYIYLVTSSNTKTGTDFMLSHSYSGLLALHCAEYALTNLNKIDSGDRRITICGRFDIPVHTLKIN